jgi:hypothetical protein
MPEITENRFNLKIQGFTLTRLRVRTAMIRVRISIVRTISKERSSERITIAEKINSIVMVDMVGIRYGRMIVIYIVITADARIGSISLGLNFISNLLYNLI